MNSKILPPRTQFRIRRVLIAGLCALLISEGIMTRLLWAEPKPAPTSSASEDLAPRKPFSVTKVYSDDVRRLIVGVGWLLEREHYTQKRLDPDICKQVLKNYFSALDYAHMIFNQTDIDEFTQKYQYNLDDMIKIKGDPTPAVEIFDRFYKRLQERYQMTQSILKEKPQFTDHEVYVFNRENLPWPKDNAEAEKIWRSRIKSELLQGKLSNDKPDQAAKAAEQTLKTVTKRYHRLLKSFHEFDLEDVLKTYLTALTRAYDPHSVYYTAQEAENFTIQNINLSLSGIGAVLQSEEGYAKIVSLVPGGPADMDKRLKPNDRIVAVAQGNDEPVDVVDMKLDKVVELIRGKKGTEVRLTVIPVDASDDSVHKEIRIIRDEVKLTEQQAKASILERTDAQGNVERLGMISLPQFYEKCASDVEKLLGRLKKENVKGVILDLRRNGGGLLDQAIELTGLFVGTGPVVQVRDSSGRIQIQSNNSRSSVYSGPLVVLVGRLSASASEIVAGALQDYNRALIVGDQSTHGKGTVQAFIALAPMFHTNSEHDPGKLKITISKFYRIAGGSTQQKGVIPDITLPSLLDYYDIGEKSLPNCMPYDEVSPAKYTPLKEVSPYLPSLSALSQTRVDKSEDFKFIREEIEILKKRLADKSVSLNEADRRKEKSEFDARKDTRKKARALHADGHFKIWDITLDAVDKDTPAVLRVKDTKAEKPKKDKDQDILPSSDETDAEDTGSDTQFDPYLNETAHILLDYMGLLKNKNKV